MNKIKVLIIGKNSLLSNCFKLKTSLRNVNYVNHKVINKIQFSGIGGSEMESHGLISHFPMSELTVMGFTEVIKHLPRLRIIFKKTIIH